MKDKNVQTKINIHVDKLPETLFGNLKQHKYLIALNVHKAYDSVMLYILDQFIQNDPYFTISEKEEWQEEIKDLNALNMNISGNIINISQGIPQDSELAPYLLNYYMSRILEDPIIIKLLNDCEITIYEDNICIVNNFENKEMCRKLVVNLNNAFNKYNLSFNREYRIIKIGGISFLNEFEGVNGLDNYQSINIFGTNNDPMEHSKKSLNFNEALFKLKYKSFDKGYNTINKAKRYIKLDWFKSELRIWLKESLVIVKISDNMILIFSANITRFDISTVIKWFKLFDISTVIKWFNLYYIRYEFGYFTKTPDIFSIIKSKYNRLDNKYKDYFNENKYLNDYFILQNKNIRYDIKYE
jgi:hypothetical protein